MKYFVVGASGFLGGTILQRLRERGAAAAGTQYSASQPGLIRFDLARERLHDHLPADYLKEPNQTAVIVATTARAMDDCALREQSDHIHIDRTLQVLRDARALGARVLFISTGYVFAGDVGYYTEEDAPGPIGDYGRQKLAVESALATEVPGALVFRLEKIVSDRSAPKNLFTQWLETVRSGRPIECIAGQTFAPTSGRDIADAAVSAVERGLGGLYHVCNSEYFVREELAHQFCRIVGLDAKIVSRPMESFGFADPRPLKTYLDASKFRRATGFSFTPMREVIEGFRRNGM